MVPITFLYDWEYPSDKDRQTVMYEFAANGAKHLVLTDTLLKMIGRYPRLYHELRQEAAKAGLDFVDAHAPFADDCDLCVPIPEVRPYMLAHLKYILQIVHDFGVKTCCVHTINKVYPEYTLRQLRDAICASLDEILPLAEKLDVTICIENLMRPGTNVEDEIYYIEKYDTPYLGACFDAGHANLMEKGMNCPDCYVPERWPDGKPKWETNVLDRMLPYIVNCHLHDNNGARDEHRLPGQGTVDWEALVPKLLTAPRLKCIQSEVIPLYAQQPIRPLCDKFRELFGTL